MAHEILVSAQGPLVFGIWYLGLGLRGMGPGLDNFPLTHLYKSMNYCRTEEPPVVEKKMPWNKAINKTRVINMLQGPTPVPTFEKIDMLGIKNKEEDKKNPLDPEFLLGPKKKYKPQKEDVVKTSDTEVMIISIFSKILMPIFNQPMSATKALSHLGFVTARGLDNGEFGALLLSNKV